MPRKPSITDPDKRIEILVNDAARIQGGIRFTLRKKLKRTWIDLANSMRGFYVMDPYHLTISSPDPDQALKALEVYASRIPTRSVPYVMFRKKAIAALTRMKRQFLEAQRL